MANAVIDEILRQGARRPRRHVLAALTTGRVESNFRNLRGGDRDSQGWRQERASLYPNPTNLRASVRRFYREAAQHDRGQGVGELAADVQRPAEQYRGRYAQHLGEAKRILGAGGGITSGGGGGRRSTSLRFSPGQAANLAQALSSLRGEAARPQPSVTTPAAPAFSASAATPEGYQDVQTSGAPMRERSPVLGALERLNELANTEVPSDVIQRGGRIDRTSPGGGNLNLKPGGRYAGTTRPVNQLARLSGLTVTSGKRSTVSTASGGVSDHYEGNTSANARDLGGTVAQMDRAAVKIARALGIKGYRKGKPLVATVNRGGLRYQILYRTNVGGDHFDHIHVGAKRL